jgi:thiamine-monophosphate kinase
MMDADGDRPDEDGLIARFFRPLATTPGAAGLMDDAATYTPPAGHDLVLTTDAVVAGVHFFPEDPPAAIARKALRVNLSDLAAKGARPVGYLLTVGLPADWTAQWLEAFAGGLAADQQAYGIPLLGGDTVKTPGPVFVSITAMGVVPEGRALRRSGAAAGDRIYVSGTIGDGAVGLMLRTDPERAKAWGLHHDERSHLLDRYLLPRPRARLAAAVLTHASAAMDISDGLLGDLERLCVASDAGAAIEVDKVPVSSGAARAAARDFDAQSAVLAGGDDYEILATIPVDQAPSFEAQARAARVPVTCIGEIVGGFSGRLRVTQGGRVLNLATRKFQHFA